MLGQILESWIMMCFYQQSIFSFIFNYEVNLNEYSLAWCCLLVQYPHPDICASNVFLFKFGVGCILSVVSELAGITLRYRCCIWTHYPVSQSRWSSILITTTLLLLNIWQTHFIGLVKRAFWSKSKLGIVGICSSVIDICPFTLIVFYLFDLLRILVLCWSW